MKPDPPSDAAKPDSAAKPRRFPRLRRWLKRTLWVCLALLLVLIIFHRPILRFALDKGARTIAKSQGMDLTWDVDGSVLNGIDLRDINIPPNEKGPVRSLTAKRITADYSVWNLLRQGPGRFVDRVILDDVDLWLDTTKFPPPDPKEPSKPPPAIDIPEVRLTNVNLRLTQADGDVIVKGLNFTLVPSSSGVLEFTDVELPGMPALKNVKGTTEVSGKKLVIKDLNVTPETLVRLLSADLGSLQDGKLPFTADIEVPGGTLAEKLGAGAAPAKVVTGKGSVALTGALGGIGKELTLDADVKAASLLPSSLAPWVMLPPDPKWSVQELTAKIAGPVNAPQKLEASFNLTGSGIEAGTVKVDKAAVTGSLSKGLLTANVTDLSTGANRLTGTFSGQLPPEWKDAGNTTFTAEANVDLPRIEELFTQFPPLAGKVSGKLTTVLKDGRWSGAAANLTGANLLTQGVPIQSMELKADTDGKLLRVTALRASLDAQNVIEATATLELAGDQMLNAEWKASIPNLERLAGLTGRKDMPGPEAGQLSGSGKVAGKLSEWARQDFSKTLADAKLNATGIAWKAGRMQSLTLSANLANGRAQLEQFAAVLNDKNKITASGSGALKSPWEFTAKVDGDLSQLKDFNGWLESFGAGKLTSGNALIKWEGSGRGSDGSLTGGGMLKVNALKMEGMQESSSVSIKTSHAGMRADVSEFEASMGQFKFSAPFTVTEKFLEVPALRITSGNLPPVEGHMKVPLNFAQKAGPAGPVDSGSAVDVLLTVKDMDLAEAARTAGQKPSVNGKVNADVKITGSITNPTADISLKLQGVSVPDMKQKIAPADATVNITLKDRKLEAKADVTQKPLQPLHATASLPLDMQKVLENPKVLQNTPLDVNVSLPDSDLNVLKQFVPAIASVKGRVGLTAKVAGTAAKPDITGSLHANASAINFVKEDMPAARNVKLNVRFAGTRVFIEDAEAMLAGGNITAHGAIDWTDTGNPKIDATVSAKEALIIRDDNMSMRADGDVVCRGSLNQASVTGRIELVRGRVFKEIEFLPLSLPNQLPPAPPSVIVSKNSAPTLPPPMDKWNFGIDIVTRDPIRLLGNVLNGGVVTELRVTGTGANMVLEGRAKLEETRVRLPFSRMTISRGLVIFTKEHPFDPQIDLQGDSFINNYQVTLYAYGRALDPKLRFTSSPPLSEGEIATLLATGSTSGDLRSSQGEAANRAAFLVLSQVYRKLFRKAAGNTRIDDEPPRLSFSFSPLNSSGGTRSVSAVYEINKHLQAVGSFNQAGSFRGLLYYLIRFR